jgi:hypothetical protein
VAKLSCFFLLVGLLDVNCPRVKKQQLCHNMSSSKTMNDLKKHFECAICSEIFKRPKSFPCHHTFCEHCLDALLQTQKSKKLPLTCPCCKKKYPNISTAKDLPINFLIQYTIHIVNVAAFHQQAKNYSLVTVDQVPKYQQHYIETYQNLELFFISEDVIDYIMIPLIDAKVLHYLKCTNSKWRTKIEEYAKKSVPMFKFVAKFGSYGSVNGQFRYPWFVANDNQGNIYISEYSNHRIQLFDSNGHWIKSIGSYGSGNGPMGIAFNSKSHMFVG